MPDEARILTAYTPAQLDRIMDVLARAGSRRQLDHRMVERELLELVHAIGLASDSTEPSRHWQEFSADDPSPKATRDGFLTLARAEDPFALARRSRKLAALVRRSPGLRRVRARLQEAGYSLSSLRRADWKGLSGEEQAAFRRAMEEAAAYAGHFVRQSRPRKAAFDTALLELADLFCSWTGKPPARHKVPYSVNSQFIQFAVAALEPVGRYYEVSHSALSGRWERIVQEEREGVREPNDADLDRDSDQDS